MLAGISTEASHLVNPFYTVQATDNWFFMIVSTFLIVAIGTFVTDRIVEPRLAAPDKIEPDSISREMGDLERKALRWPTGRFSQFCFSLQLAVFLQILF